MKILESIAVPWEEFSHTHVVEAVLDGAKERGAETELVDLRALDIQYCLGCQVCYAEASAF